MVRASDKGVSAISVPEVRQRRVIIVTGASAGIGREVARSAARHGFAVVAVARRRERLDTLASEVANDGGTCVPIALDVTTSDAAKRIIGVALQRFGRIDVLLNNAGFATAGALLEQSDAQIDTQWNVHVAAPLRLTREALPALRAAHGQVLFVGSGLARVPAPNFGAYCAAKAAVRAAAMQLHRELRGSGVAVTYVDPGSVDTEFSQAAGMARSGRSGVAVKADYVARRILIAVEKRPARFNAVPWQSAAVALGAAFPRLADAAIARIADRPQLAQPMPAPGPPRPTPQPVAPPETPSESDFARALAPVARRMERVNLPASVLAGLLQPGVEVQLSDAAMQWAGMPNKNERAAMAEALDALTAGGFLERVDEERWRVMRAAD